MSPTWSKGKGLLPLTIFLIFFRPLWRERARNQSLTVPVAKPLLSSNPKKKFQPATTGRHCSFTSTKLTLVRDTCKCTNPSKSSRQLLGIMMIIKKKNNFRIILCKLMKKRNSSSFYYLGTYYVIENYYSWCLSSSAIFISLLFNFKFSFHWGRFTFLSFFSRG